MFKYLIVQNRRKKSQKHGTEALCKLCILHSLISKRNKTKRNETKNVDYNETGKDHNDESVDGMEFDKACCRLRKNEIKLLNDFRNLHRACNNGAIFSQKYLKEKVNKPRGRRTIGAVLSLEL